MIPKLKDLLFEKDCNPRRKKSGESDGFLHVTLAKSRGRSGCRRRAKKVNNKISFDDLEKFSGCNAGMNSVPAGLMKVATLVRILHNKLHHHSKLQVF